jgi:hypothetical protein
MFHMGERLVAVAAGVLTVFGLGWLADLGLRELGVSSLPLALGCRLVFAVAGGYLAARLAPYGYRIHAAIAGGFVAFIVAIETLAYLLEGTPHRPLWYSVALILLVVPCAFAGGVLTGRKDDDEE